MAIVSPPSKAFNRDDTDRRVRHPLQTIRGDIRRYVLTEGIALAVLYTAVCLWLGLAVDFLLWSVFSFDWLFSFNELTGVGATTGLRAVILLVVVVGLGLVVGIKIFRRLFKEFSDAAVAMLLERRFPKELGDRLITAVELADPRLSQKYGYSQAMVDATIRDAAERVEKLPVHELFRWGRLRVKVLLAMVATVGLYVLVGLTWCVFRGASPSEFVVRFHHTASIWSERNLFMMNSFWPPGTHIELIRFPGAELRVPRDEDRPDVKVRSTRWVVAAEGADAPRGWRPLRFEDLKGLLPKDMLAINLPEKWDNWVIDLDDCDLRVAAGAIPPEWRWQGATSGRIRSEMAKDDIKQVLDRGDKKARARDALVEMLNWHNWTVNKIELQLQYSDPDAKKNAAERRRQGEEEEAARIEQFQQPVAAAMKATNKEDYDKFVAILAKLDELASQPSMGRTLRKLTDPGESEVVAVYKNKTSDGLHVCSPIENRKYLFPLSKLKESCQFSISSGDYWTPWRQIHLTPPPVLDDLRIDKDEPAYLHYRMLDNPALLKGKRQKIRSVSVSKTGPYSKVEVPLGADVTIVGHANRELHDIRVAEPEAKKREEKISVTLPAQVDLAQDQQTFTCSFKDLRRIVEFDFEFKDKDGVKGSRRIIIMPQEDQPPRINELALAVPPRLFDSGDDSGRGVASGPRWVVTPDAFLRLRGKVEDDHGLSKLDYRYELVEVEFQNLTADAADKPGEPSGPEPKRPTRGLGAPIVVGGLQYVPGPSAYGFLAASYYGGLVHIVKEGTLPPPPPRVDQIAMQRAKQRLERAFAWEATPVELERLLTIQPGSRKLLLEALTFKADKRALESFVVRLKEENKTEGFLREVMDFAGFGVGADRAKLEELVAADPAEALVQMLEKMKADPAELETTRAILDKESEKSIIARYDLQDEDGVFGFDLRERLAFIKAVGSSATQKHYVMRLSIVATDNNIFTGPGQTTASLPYGFLIVSENELLYLMMKDQRKYHGLLNAAVQELEQKRGYLESQLIDYRKNPEEPTKLLVRGEAAKKSLRDGGFSAKAIFLKYESLLKEMEFNRMKKDRIDKVRVRIADPFGALISSNGAFPKADALASTFCKELAPDADRKEKADLIQQGDDPALLKQLLANKDQHIANTEQLLTEMTELIRDLNKILDAMSGLITEDVPLELLVVIEAAQRELDNTIRIYERMFRDHILQSLIPDGGGGDKK